MTKFVLFIFLVVFASCNSGTSTTSTDNSSVDKADSSKKQVSYPYAIGYSAQFEFIDPNKGKMVLDLWKDYDNNSFDNSKEKFADTVTMLLPGMEMHASRDSIISATKSSRNLYNSVTSKLDVVMSVRSTDKKGDWVLVWGTEIHTDKKNVTDSFSLHEVWGLNKDGKVEFMQQYISHK